MLICKKNLKNVKHKKIYIPHCVKSEIWSLLSLLMTLCLLQRFPTFWDLRTTTKLFPEIFLKFHSKKILLTFSPNFHLLTRISVIHGFRAAISFFSTIYMSNYKHFTNINQFHFSTKHSFPPFWGTTNQRFADHHWSADHRLGTVGLLDDFLTY